MEICARLCLCLSLLTTHCCAEQLHALATCRQSQGQEAHLSARPRL